MKPAKIALLLSLGFFLADTAFARTWIDKDGKEIEAEFVKADEKGEILTLKKGEKDFSIALKTLSENDQKWIAEHLAALEEAKKNEAKPNEPKDEIFLLLNKSPEEVTAALKTLKMVDDMESLKTAKRVKFSDGSEGIQHIFDGGKVKFEYFGGKLTGIDLCLNDGYTGVMPLGLKKEMRQKEATALLEKHDFKLIDWGTSPPGWGLAHSLNSSPKKVVAVMTLLADSPELAVVRIMQQ